MSTFRGVVAEFPDIRIDFFRRSSGTLPPLACFLSHVHSDHLAGLDSLKSPFVYCSPATREILLRLEKYPHRMNFALKILESRKQTYKHLDKILKPIPLETPTKIELAPGNVITVTLFDANHCPGAVMFLIENDEKSILYTGDIRSEPSFVTNLRRNPYLIEYTTGIKTLDCVYLDTSNTENISFPSKAEGLAELLQKVSKYPNDTVFHVSSWTYGYEEVWMALSKVLKSQIHVDRYKMRIYQSLVGNGTSPTGPFISYEGPILAGYQCGNTKQDGCLTEDPNVRLHSCEKGLHCPIISNNSKVVWITPIVTRTREGEDVEESGIGGGGGDLVQRPELELANAADIEEFLSLLGGLDYATENKLRQRFLSVLLSSKMAISLDDLGLSGLDRDQNEMSLENFAALISKSISSDANVRRNSGPKYSIALPRQITFPYSRHSSFPELCELVSAFNPKDVYPCTVDESEWHEGISIRALFGRHCSATKYRHDVEMRQLQTQKVARAASVQTHTTESSEEDDSSITAEPAKTIKKVIKRDSRGRLRVFTSVDDQVEELPRHQSPPSEIMASSPGSQSQNLRRKAILQELSETRKAKRPCLAQTDGAASSPLRPSPSRSRVGTQSGRQDEPIELYTSPNSTESDVEPDTPGSSEEDNSEDEIRDQLRYLRRQTFYDHRDNVQRCIYCEHELNSLMGPCERCEEVEDDDERRTPYYEVLGPESGARLEIAFNEYDDELMDEEDRLRYVGEYLDDESSAYDSQDEDSNLCEEYDEEDSFIDTTPEKPDDSDESTDGSDNDEEPDWEQKFKELQAAHDSVVAKHKTLGQRHEINVIALEQTEEKYYNLLDHVGLPYTSDEEDDDDADMEEEIDEEGNILVNPPALVPTVHEVVLANAEDNSQNSELTSERIKDRVGAFEAVGFGGEGWENISLLSTGHNHSMPEVEL